MERREGQHETLGWPFDVITAARTTRQSLRLGGTPFAVDAAAQVIRSSARTATSEESTERYGQRVRQTAHRGSPHGAPIHG